jgi:hypothetical protein
MDKSFKLLQEAYKIINDAQGQHSQVIDIGNNLVKKTPLRGGTFSDNEFKKLTFMANNKNNIFVTFHDITAQYATTDKLDLTIKTPVWKWIKNNIVTDHENDTVGKYGGESCHDSDAVGQFISNDILSPTPNMGVFETIEYYSVDDPVASLLVDYMLRISTVRNWPVDRFDIHIDNIGLDKKDNKLKVFDF